MKCRVCKKNEVDTIFIMNSVRLNVCSPECFKRALQELKSEGDE